MAVALSIFFSFSLRICLSSSMLYERTCASRLICMKIFKFLASAKFYNPAFSQPSSIDFSYKSYDLKHFSMLNIAINIDALTKHVILIKSNIKFSSVCFFAVASGRRSILHRYYSPASHALLAEVQNPDISRRINVC